jgi:hypothetical protein
MALSLRDRKTQLRLAGGVVAILAVFLILKVFSGGSATTSSPTPSVTLPSGVPSASPTPTPTPPPVVVFSGRDPFQNLFGPASSGSSSSSSSTGSTTPPASGTSTPPPSGTTTPPPSSGGNGNGDGGQGSGATIGGHSVLLDDIFIAQGGIRKAQVEVDGTVYTVAAGQSFDDNFKLVSFPSASCAHFVFGDEGFTLCTSGGK